MGQNISRLASNYNRQKGIALVEYSMSITLIAIACIAGVTAVGWGVKKNFCLTLAALRTVAEFHDDDHMCYVDSDGDFFPNEVF